MAASWRRGEDPPRPDAVGILAIEVYFPQQKVSMAAMEAADGCPGKYTLGLGQEAMAFGSDREDAVSMALTVTQGLMEKYGVRPEEIGYLQVATESGVDRSKSIKSHLMQLFQQPQQQPQQQPAAILPLSAPQRSQAAPRGCFRGCPPAGPPAEGVDCTHACFGATSALLAAAAWLESRRWDGRMALVVAADVALYAPGSAARPTGGCGAAALLVGPDAPLVLDPLWYGTHAEHAWDFYKPLGRLPYPEVDGALTLSQYLGAAGHCAARLGARLAAAGELRPGEGFLPHVSYFLGHSPFNKLLRKGLARIALADGLRAAAAGSSAAGAHAAETADAVAAVATDRAAAAAAAPPLDPAAKSGAEPRNATVCGAGRQQQREGPHQQADSSPQPQEWVEEWMREQEQEQPQGQEQAQQRLGHGELESPSPGVVCASGPSEVAAYGSSVASCGAAGTCAPATPPAPTVAPSRSASAAAEATAAGNVAAANRASGGAAPPPQASQPSSAAAAAAATQQHTAALHPTPPDTTVQTRHTNSDPDCDPLRLESLLGLGTAGGPTVQCQQQVQLPESSELYGTWRLADKALEAQLLAATSALYDEKAEDAAWLQKQLGNSYTASLWQGLAALVARRGPQLAGSRLLLFSFGSGTLAALFSLVARGSGGSGDGGSKGGAVGGSGRQEGKGEGLGNVDESGLVGTGEEGRAVEQHGDGGDARDGGRCTVGVAGEAGRGSDVGPSDPRFTLEAVQCALDLNKRLRGSVERSVPYFNAVSEHVEASYACPVPYEPKGDLADVPAGAYYLARVDGHSRRWYERKV